MTWIAQLWHVFRKDLTEQWRLLLVYVAIVVVATLHGLEWQPVSRAGSGFTMVLLALMGVTLVGAAVQSDSPTRSDAFWVSHPFDRSAMWMTKVCFALLVLAIALAGQVIVVRSFDVHGLDAFAAAGKSALFYGALILIALVVAGLTRDLRSFGLGLVLVPVAIFVITLSTDVARLQLHVTPGAIVPLKWAAVALEIGVFAWLYHHRDARGRGRMTAYAACVIGISAFTLDRQPSPETHARAATAPRAVLSLERQRNSEARDRFGLTLQLVVRPGEPGFRHTLLGPIASIAFRDGTSLRVAMTTASLDVSSGQGAMLPRSRGFQWLEDRPVAVQRVALNAVLSSEQLRRIREGAVSIVVEGRMVVSEAVPLATMPLREGAELNRNGLRVRISGWRHDDGDPALSLHSRRVVGGEDGLPALNWSQQLNYALVNPGRREALGLDRLQSGSSLDGMVLPASTLLRETGQYGRGIAVQLDEEWLRGAELMIVGEREIGSYAVRLETKE